MEFTWRFPCLAKDPPISPSRKGGFPIDLMWELPQLAAFVEALGRLARVIVWDQRGFGASDPVPDATAARTEMFADDMLAILEAANADRVTAFEMSASS